MIAFVTRSAKRIVCVGVLFAAAAGIAYAAIPDSTGVYTACMLDKVGTVRLIDPSLPASNLMSHCTSAETKFTFNQQGQQGAPGPPGSPGKDGANGANGVSPTVTQLSAGDPNCGAGGAAITDAAGNKAYVCNGADGKNGQPFAGTFTSANGQFSITIDDSGIKLAGPSNSLKLEPDGTVATVAGTSLDLKSGGATTLDAGGSLTAKSGGSTSLDAGNSLDVTSGGSTSLDVGGSLGLQTGTTANLTIGTSLTASVGGAANVVAGSLDLKATGAAILEATGPLTLKGSVINAN